MNKQTRIIVAAKGVRRWRNTTPGDGFTSTEFRDAAESASSKAIKKLLIDAAETVERHQSEQAAATATATELATLKSKAKTAERIDSIKLPPPPKTRGDLELEYAAIRGKDHQTTAQLKAAFRDRHRVELGL